MEKSEKASLCVIILIDAFGFSIVAMYFENQYDETHFNVGPGQELWLDFQRLAKSNGDYHICLTVNTSVSQRIDKFLINPTNNTTGSITTSKEEVNNLDISINGTAVDMAKPLNNHLNSGDCVQVDFTFPCTEYASNSTIDVTVFTSHAMYYQYIVLP